MTRRRWQFVHAQVAWMLATILLLSLLDHLSLELFFVASLVGLLTTMELTASFNVAPRWRTRLRWVALVGLLGFGLVVVRRMLSIIGVV